MPAECESYSLQNYGKTQPSNARIVETPHPSAHASTTFNEPQASSQRVVCWLQEGYPPGGTETPQPMIAFSGKLLGRIVSLFFAFKCKRADAQQAGEIIACWCPFFVHATPRTRYRCHEGTSTVDADPGNLVSALRANTCATWSWCVTRIENKPGGPTPGLHRGLLHAEILH